MFQLHNVNFMFFGIQISSGERCLHYIVARDAGLDHQKRFCSSSLHLQFSKVVPIPGIAAVLSPEQIHFSPAAVQRCCISTTVYPHPSYTESYLDAEDWNS